MKLSDEGYDAIRGYETYVDKPRPDSVAGVMTYGYGHVKHAGDKTTFISEPDARELLRADVAIFESAVNRLVTVPLTQSQFDALVSFAFNEGASGRGFGGSTLLRKLNDGDYEGAAAEFPRWNKYTLDGVFHSSETLTNRRAAERVMFERVDAPLNVA